MIPKATKSVRGSGNIYRDFDVPDADVRQLKAALAAKIIMTLDKKGLSVRKAQSLTGIDAGEFSRVRKADFRRISVERLMAMLNGLGLRLEVAVKVIRTKAQNAAPAPSERLRRALQDYKDRTLDARASTFDWSPRPKRVRERAA
ncbi:MAG: XRE family transcriptional regulator [Betaproteobacteria bacterium]|nr:XRE family transcriptional regulator [Betaproteobacteria bacterium]